MTGGEVVKGTGQSITTGSYVKRAISIKITNK